MKKTKFFAVMILALVMCCSLSVPFASAAGGIYVEDGWEYISASLVPDSEDGIAPQIDLKTNGRGILHYNNLLRSAYAETEAYPWVKTTWMYAKVTIGTRTQEKSYNGATSSIKTNTLYAGPGEYTAKTNHSVTSTENGRQNYIASHTFT